MIGGQKIRNFVAIIPNVFLIMRLAQERLQLKVRLSSGRQVPANGFRRYIFSRNALPAIQNNMAIFHDFYLLV